MFTPELAPLLRNSDPRHSFARCLAAQCSGGLIANSSPNKVGPMMTRHVVATTAAVLLGCGSVSAQVGGISVFPGPTFGMTSPLGVGPGSPVPPIRIPMGATENRAHSVNLRRQQ